MHKFMASIGFSECYSKKQLDEIIKRVLSDPDEDYVVEDFRNRKLFQTKKQFSSRFGVSVIGEIDQFGFRNVLFSFPYLNGSYLTLEDEIQIQKYAEKDAFAGISEDYHVGVSLIFYVLNISEMVSMVNHHPGYPYQKVKLSALSTNGIVIFGIERNESQLKKENEGTNTRNYLIQEAKNGDVEAIESLTMEDIDLYSIILKRAKTEDIYSIVDTSFLPFGVESDQYSILARIDAVQKHRNQDTNEFVYVLELTCNDINLSLAINSKDLYGEPRIGRRFKGDIWLQGILPIDREDLYD